MRALAVAAGLRFLGGVGGDDQGVGAVAADGIGRDDDVAEMRIGQRARDRFRDVVGETLVLVPGRGRLVVGLVLLVGEMTVPALLRRGASGGRGVRGFGQAEQRAAGGRRVVAAVAVGADQAKRENARVAAGPFAVLVD